MNEYKLKHYYFIDRYTKFELKHCYNDRYNSYNTVAEAKEACNLDSGCQAVYDNGCDESNNDVYLCRMGATYSNSGSSCIYEKGKIWYFVAKLET